MDNGKGAGINSADVKAQAREFGADLVNISSCEGYEKALPGCKPEDLVKDAKSVVVFARRMPFGNATPRPSVGTWNSAITGTRPGSTSSHTGWRSGSRMRDTWRCPRPQGGTSPRSVS